MRQLVIILMFLGALIMAAGAAATSGNSDAPTWAAPVAMAVKRVSTLPEPQNHPNLIANLDCTPASYRTGAGHSLQVGCFTPTSFGQFDSDSDTVIYNSTDEALPLLPYSSHEILTPWPQAGVLLALDAAAINGSYINIYKGPLGVMRDQRDALGQITAKQLVAPPDLQLRAPNGQPLIINSQTIAFSNGGSWLVAEDLSGSFVRFNLATLSMLPFAPAYGSSGSPALLRSQVAISHDGRYVAINNEAAGALKVYDLDSCTGSINANLSPLNCNSYDYRYFVAQQIAGLQNISHLSFLNNGLISLEVHAATSANSGMYELSPSGTITSLTDYLGLGDSYTSGEGAFDYLPSSNTGNDVCHVSLNSYPLLITHDLFSGPGGHSVACSGAEINDVGDLSDGYRGQVKDAPDWKQLQTTDRALLGSVMANFLPGYMAQARFVEQYQPGLTTVSVGGDDIGFGDILQRCVIPKLSLHASSNDCFNTYEDRVELKKLIDRTVPRWTSLYKSLARSAPVTRLYVIGYPQVVADTGNCGLNVHLSQSEREFTEEIIDYLNGDIAKAAADAHVPYVDISQALNGHRLCEAPSYDVAVNGLTAGRDAGVLGINVFGKASYHPNALGQQLIEQAILSQTKNFAPVTTSARGAPDDSNLLKAPKSGRSTSVLIKPAGLATPAISSKKLSIKLGGANAGLVPNSAYTVHIDGPFGSTLGTLTGDSGGSITGVVNLPDNVAPGGHTIDITGGNQAGEPIDASQPVYVPVSPTDSDGDGLADDNDSCPYAVNSGQDTDHDGIDDVCDSFISRPPRLNNEAKINSNVLANRATAASNHAAPAATTTKLSAHAISKTTPVPAKNSISIKPITEPGKNQLYAPAKDRLKSINWLVWAVLPLVAWWLIVFLILTARQCLNRQSRYQK